MALDRFIYINFPPKKPSNLLTTIKNQQAIKCQKFSKKHFESDFRHNKNYGKKTMLETRSMAKQLT